MPRSAFQMENGWLREEMKWKIPVLVGSCWLQRAKIINNNGAGKETLGEVSESMYRSPFRLYITKIIKNTGRAMRPV
jgi:hypothetical protein